MVITGRVENGVVVFPQDVFLPEGSEVSVVVHELSDVDSDKMTEPQRARYLEALARFDALPNENPDDAFSGADHDRVLYGDAL